MATERMGLRVVKNTLKPDWDRGADFNILDLADVLGCIEIELTKECILQPEVVDEIAELMANEEVYENLERTVVIEAWRVQRTDNKIAVYPVQFRYEDPDFHAAPSRRGWSGFDSVVWLVLLIPNFLMWN